ncbi:D-alanine--poly(phosphoribitol) ligase subunit 1 [Vibrio ruber DSM 16370]|uniref:D-alanine--poly(Phosphoribitol) ligase subunit 1 n=1 Tax=Vibrio ruber (strain DSM 16370 / JCM 11486 / BCRC 17186 / CECT 7878 / LMG 23124 / VR1) TaxID=1123498 RepID=A0A1R4LDZ3_VIBR1|nr:AMP-binding protein [Vibrio ruber]SJN54633.1 D-alanine--poly(phosphoribitol) ligase subunit 1 [Vibrio ruber DSM 16370]
MTKHNHLGTQLAEVIDKYGEHLALTIDRESYTYTQLHDIAELIARSFSDASGKYCAVFGDGYIGAYAGLMACMCYGKTYLPLNRDESGERLVLLAEWSKFDVLIVSSLETTFLNELLEQVPQSITVIFVDVFDVPDWCHGIERHRFLALADLRQCPQATYSTANPDAYLMFTSGSTGTPKGVQVSHRNLMSYITNTVNLYQPNHTDRFSLLAPLSFDFSVHDIWVPWAVGASTHFFNPKDHVALGPFIREKRLTFWASVPSTVLFLQRLKQLTPNAFPDLRQSLFCGEPLLHGMAMNWSRAAPASRIDNMYGPTEATVAVGGYRWLPDDQIDMSSVVPIGTPYPGIVFRLGDARTGDKHDGELWISGDQVVPGYWDGLPTSTDSFFWEDGQCWYRTGDWVRYTEDGVFHFSGRCDDQIKVHGHRLERLEIESELRKAVDVDDVAVVGWPVVEGNSVEGLVFFIASEHGSNIELRQQCMNRMPRNMWPTKLVLGAIPKNRNGKTDYRMLKEMLKDNQQTQAVSLARR